MLPFTEMPVPVLPGLLEAPGRVLVKLDQSCPTLGEDGHGLRLQDRALLAGFGLESRRLGSDFDLLLRCADRQLGINGQNADRQVDAIANEAVETFLSKYDPVVSWKNGDRIVNSGNRS